jgi:hypothetical protein
MERAIPLRLPTEERQALATLAVLEYRDVNDQATYLIVEGLRRRGLLPTLKTAPTPESASAAPA